MRNFQGPGRSVVYGLNTMCATSHPLASRTAMEVLRDGGNAVDAAVASAVLLGFCEPMMTGLGGDVFALIQPPGNAEPLALNGSGRSPAALDAAILREQGQASIGLESAHSVSIPGAVDAFDRLVRDHGRLDLAACLAPAIRYAEQGVPVAPRTATDWHNAAGRLGGRSRELLLRDGKAYQVGEVFRAPEQAGALRLIAKQGRSAFYEGEVARDMVDSLNALGGLHTMDDFAATACDYVTPMSVSYHGHELLELPPNGQGPTALLMAKMLSRFKLASMDPFGAQRAHLEAEVAKIAYDARNRFIADPSFGPLAIDRMLSDTTVDALVALIDPRKAIGRVHETTEAVHTDTVYLTVIDADRLAVSLIYSIFHPFGSGLSSNRFGITFQNRGAGMNLTEGHVNELKGRKRPMHTLIPGMLRRRGEYVLPFGVMGGQYQAAGHARFVSNLVDYGMDLQQAMDGPRSFPEPASGELTLEAGYPDGVAAELVAMGHKVVRPAVGIGGSQAIRADLRTGVLAGASDPRKDGCALGS